MGTRKLPEGWEYQELGKLIIEKQKSKIKVGDASSEGKYIFFTSGKKTKRYNDFLVDGKNLYLATGGKAIIHFYDGKASYSTDTFVLSNKENIDFKILYYYILYKIDYIDNSLFTGAGIKHLQKREFKKLKIYFPTSKEEQEKIVNYLDEKFKYIDEMEASRERYVEHLEKLEKAVLRDVFENIKGEYTIENLFRISSGNLVEREELSENGKYPVYGGNGIIGKTDNYNIDGEYIVIGRVGAKAGNVRLVNGKNRISDNALYIKEYLKDFNKKYLYWNLIFLDLNSKASVSNRPLISYKGIKDIKIKYPDIKTQKIIACELDKKFELIRDSRERLKRQEENYKNLRKAFLNDVFGGFEE